MPFRSPYYIALLFSAILQCSRLRPMCVIALFPPRYLLGCESHNRLPHRTSATTVTPVICLCRPPTIGYWKSESALHEDARSLSYWYIIIIVHAHVDSLPPYFPHRHLPNPLTIRSLLCLPFSPDLRHAIFTPPFEMLIDSPPHLEQLLSLPHIHRGHVQQGCSPPRVY